MTTYARQARDLFDRNNAAAHGGRVFGNSGVAITFVNFAQYGDVGAIRLIREQYQPGKERDEQLATILARREQVYREQLEALNKLVEDAKAHEIEERPENIQRRVVMQSPALMAKSASVRTMVAGAQVAEIQQLAKDAVARGDDATAYALRVEIASRPVEQMGELAPVLYNLNSTYAARHAETVANIIGAQVVRLNAMTAGPLFEEGVSISMNMTTLAGRMYEAYSYVDAKGETVTFHEDKVRTMLYKLGVTDKEPEFNTAPAGFALTPPGVSQPQAA